MVAQETLRKSGYAVQQDEEQLRCVIHTNTATSILAVKQLIHHLSHCIFIA